MYKSINVIIAKRALMHSRRNSHLTRSFSNEFSSLCQYWVYISRIRSRHWEFRLRVYNKDNECRRAREVWQDTTTIAYWLHGLIFLLICFRNCDVGARSNEGGVMRVISAMQLQTGRHLNTLSSEPQIWLYDATKYYCYCYFFLLLTQRHYSSNLLLASWLEGPALLVSGTTWWNIYPWCVMANRGTGDGKDQHLTKIYNSSLYITVHFSCVSEYSK